ncbi:hypothetical protein KHA93_11630 [Bacillus sp. FJAT-49732]|uniref:Uncharacterized protein n=1 Tax=Lederbergia citrisecunda TaxID=2833583 RepID=A0A942TP32_9BACI|nr:hypothetical protein [Lederbergia citrisecunda]MBS4200281.1 hypothetical protein [Lederbergia citrisecunda]
MAKEQNNEKVEQTIDIEALKQQLKEELQVEMQKEMEEARIAAEKKEAEEEKRAEVELAKLEMSMKKRLSKEKKVPIFIPEDPLNPDDVVPVGVNGVIYAIPRGQQFDVPESIYKAWKYSYDETVKANKKIKFEQNKQIQVL